MECRGFESHLRQLIFLTESDCFGCAVLLCLVVCLTLFASSFLPSHLSLKHVTCTTHKYMYYTTDYIYCYCNTVHGVARSKDVARIEEILSKSGKLCIFITMGHSLSYKSHDNSHTYFYVYIRIHCTDICLRKNVPHLVKFANSGS